MIFFYRYHNEVHVKSHKRQTFPHSAVVSAKPQCKISSPTKSCSLLPYDTAHTIVAKKYLSVHIFVFNTVAASDRFPAC